MDNYIYIQNKRYNYYDTFYDFKKAVKVGKAQKKKNKSKWFILPVEKGFLFPRKAYRLYLNRVMRLGF